MARDEAGSDPAGHRLQLTFADQRANLVLGAAELNGNLADGQWNRPVHDRSIAHSRGPSPMRLSPRSPTLKQSLRRVKVVLADENLRRARDGEPSALGAD